VLTGWLSNGLTPDSVISGRSRVGGSSGVLGAANAGQVPVPQHLHPGIELLGVFEEFLRQSGVSFGSRLSCLGEEPLGSDLGAVLLPQVGSVRV